MIAKEKYGEKSVVLIPDDSIHYMETLLPLIFQETKQKFQKKGAMIYKPGEIKEGPETYLQCLIIHVSSKTD